MVEEKKISKSPHGDDVRALARDSAALAGPQIRDLDGNACRQPNVLPVRRDLGGGVARVQQHDDLKSDPKI